MGHHSWFHCSEDSEEPELVPQIPNYGLVIDFGRLRGQIAHLALLDVDRTPIAYAIYQRVAPPLYVLEELHPPLRPLSPVPPPSFSSLPRLLRIRPISTPSRNLLVNDKRLFIYERH